MTLHIGRPYHPDTWNCATCAADYYNHKLPCNEWTRAILYWVARNFVPVDEPQNGDLVFCNYTTTGGLHAGIYLEQGVYHAYRLPGKRGGDTVITDHNMFRRNFKKIRYYRWRQ